MSARFQASRIRHGLKRHWSTLALTVIVLVTLSIIIGKLYDWYQTTQVLTLPPATVTITDTDYTPNEAKPDLRYTAYNVPPDLPKRITISNIGVQGFVQQVGIDQQGAIAAPSNVHLAGWYNGSSKPGNRGISIIDGHVSGRYGPGIFERLGEVRDGAIIEVEYGNGRKVSFKVVRHEQFDANKAAPHLFEPIVGLDSQLVLVTCSGNFNTALRSYDRRLVVYAQLINE